MFSNDPLLQPFAIKHLQLRNRVVSTSHEPAYTDQGMPRERYRLYHEEKAKGGVALTMIGGSSIVAPDSPPAFGNLEMYRDEIVPWLRELSDGVHQQRNAPIGQERSPKSRQSGVTLRHSFTLQIEKVLSYRHNCVGATH